MSILVPSMVYVPGGMYTIGSTLAEQRRYCGFRREGPRHAEIIEPFEVGEYPVTRAEYRAFVAATGRRTHGYVWAHDDNRAYYQHPTRTWEDPGFEQEDDHPVVGVNWEDATDYAGWLAKETGRNYRLLTEAEWEYAARAGTVTPYWCGNTIAGKAHYTLPKGMLERVTCPVSKYGPNAFGLYGVHGNVWDWCSSRWRDSYEHDPPEKGHARENNEGWGNCSCIRPLTDYQEGVPQPAAAQVQDFLMDKPCLCRVIRGGSFANLPDRCRSAFRMGFAASERAHNVGFRVARSPCRRSTI